jgi:RNA polymerase sigma-70 factor (ECF subfamily)
MTGALALDVLSLGDEELAARARAGDRDAFRAIMQRCNQRLFRVARGIVRDDAEAEDVLQEAYARAFAAIGAFRGDSALSTWLTRIVLNEARGRVRRRRATVDLDQIETAQATGGQVLAFPSLAGEDPERSAAGAEIRRLLERAVDGLPEPYRLVFMLREVEECTVEETAATLGIKPETVKTRLFRARRLLRKALDETLSDALVGAYPFLGARCERIQDAVIRRLGLADAEPIRPQP